AGKLILNASELLFAPPHDSEINHHRLKQRLQFFGWGNRCQPAERGSPNPHHLASVGLPSKRTNDANENRNGEAAKGANCSPGNRWPGACDLCVLETRGARKRVWPQPVHSIGLSALGSVNNVFRIWIVESWTFGVHRPRTLLIDTVGGHHDLTARGQEGDRHE